MQVLMGPRSLALLRQGAAACSARVCLSKALARRTLSTSHSERPAPNIWAGLRAWREAGIDRRYTWGNGEPAAAASGLQPRPVTPPDSLEDGAQAVLEASEPRDKILMTHALWEECFAGRVRVGGGRGVHLRLPSFPGRPLKPELVSPRSMPSPKTSGLPAAAFMLHNLAHVELNAIDLAWDTVARFSHLGLPVQFYRDFARVADDEARHLGWCLDRLEELGCAYGDMPAHNLLWEGAQATFGNLKARLAVVPMSQESRGLDAGPRLTQRLVGLGDARSAAIVRRISAEEYAHVAVGVYWFRAWCHAAGLDPGASYRSTLRTLCPDLLRAPFADAARTAVGMPCDWYNPQLWNADERRALEEACRQSRSAPHEASRAPEPGPNAPETMLVAELRLRLEAFASLEEHMVL